MMLHTKHEHKYFNKKMIMLLLLLILMWSLREQHVYGKSSTCSGCDAAGGQGKIVRLQKKNMADMAKQPSVTTTVNEHGGNNKATTKIYGHINENDNNSHKLPQNVEEEDQEQANMIKMNMKLATTVAAVKTSKATEKQETSLSPIESGFKLKHQLNETKRNTEIRSSPENEPQNVKQQQKLKINFNDKRSNKSLGESVKNNNSTDLINHEKTKLKRNKTSGADNKAKEKAFKSIAHAQQELITQFALKLKLIPRITYFTCKEPNVKQINRVLIEEFVRRLYSSKVAKAPMIRIVFIDHLAHKNRARKAGATPTMGFNRFYGSSVGSTAQNMFRNANWLEEILAAEPLRQILVLDLNCGVASRRLLEMASNKAFFNSMYHWLLLEDYVFNRQTEIDDANDMKGKMNSTKADKSLKKEIVNDSTATKLQVKKLFTYPTDVVGAHTSGSGLTDKQNHDIATSILGSTFKTFLTDKSSKFLNVSRGRITDEHDIEIIEKFLEKLNININTELILAKRYTCIITNPTNAAHATSSNMMPAATHFASMDSYDYNALQKMDYYLLYDVWNPGLQYGGVLNITKIGYFSRSKGFQLDKRYKTTSTVRRRPNMHLARVRCLVVVTHKNRSDTLEEYLTSHYDTHLDSMNRFNFALLTHVRDLFNFSFILSKTSTWGYLKNGKFDGMIGALVRQQADIGGSPIFFRIERAKVIDYTTRTWVARPCFIFRHPRSTSKDRIVFLQPFSNQVWIFLLVCGFSTIILLWLLTSLERKFNPKEFSNSREGVLTQNKKKIVCLKKWGRHKANVKCKPSAGLFFESLVFYIGSICQQGIIFSTYFISGRCVIINSLLFSFCIYQFYSASIVGTLLMERPKTIRTLRDLTHSSLGIGIEDIVYNRDYFLRTKDPAALELYAKKVTTVPKPLDAGYTATTSSNSTLPTQMTQLTVAQKAKIYRDILHSHETGAHAKTNEASNWYDPDYGLAKVKQGHFAFHVDVATAYKIIADTFREKEICELAEVELFPPQKMVSIVQKGSPLRKVITYGLRRVTEVGLTDYQRKVWHSPKPRCVKQLHTDDLRVDMQTFTSALLVLIFGYAVSVLILSLEILHFKIWQRYTTLRK